MAERIVLPEKLETHIEEIAVWIADLPEERRDEAFEVVEAEVEDYLYAELFNRGEAE